MNKEEQLKSDHYKQRTWLENQINKPLLSSDESSFLNVESAQRAFKKMIDNCLIVSDSDIEHFVSVHLSKQGKKRLITALRVYRHRENSHDRDLSKRLQTEITGKNHRKLVKIITASGKSKKDVINKIIEEANMNLFEE